MAALGPGSCAQLPSGRWNLPRPGTLPTSPASAGGFLPTVPLGKSLSLCFNVGIYACVSVQDLSKLSALLLKFLYFVLPFVNEA